MAQTEVEEEPTFITKNVRVPAELIARMDTWLELQDSDFSKFCRVAIRERLERLESDKKVSRR